MRMRIEKPGFFNLMLDTTENITTAATTTQQQVQLQHSFTQLPTSKSEEMLEMQGIPIYDDALFACGVAPLFNREAVSAAACRKMAGNSFSQPCMSAFIGFCLAHLNKATIHSDTHKSANQTPTKTQIVYTDATYNDDDGFLDDEDPNEDRDCDHNAANTG